MSVNGNLKALDADLTVKVRAAIEQAETALERRVEPEDLSAIASELGLSQDVVLRVAQARDQEERVLGRDGRAQSGKLAGAANALIGACQPGGLLALHGHSRDAAGSTRYVEPPSKTALALAQARAETGADLLGSIAAEVARTLPDDGFSQLSRSELARLLADPRWQLLCSSCDPAAIDEGVKRLQQICPSVVDKVTRALLAQAQRNACQRIPLMQVAPFETGALGGALPTTSPVAGAQPGPKAGASALERAVGFCKRVAKLFCADTSTSATRHPTTEQLLREGRLDEHQAAWLDLGEPLLAKADTAAGIAPVAVSIGTGKNNYSLTIGRSLLLALSDGSVIKVKGCGAEVARRSGGHKMVGDIVPSHLPFAPGDFGVPTWAAYFYGESDGFAALSVRRCATAQRQVSLVFPELAGQVPRAMGSVRITSVKEQRGHDIPYALALGNARYYLENAEVAQFDRLRALLIKNMGSQALARTPTATLLHLAASATESFGFKPDYARDVVAQGGADKISEHDYLVTLYLAAEYCRQKGLPAQSRTWEPSRLRNSASVWVASPHLACVAEGDAAPTLTKQAERVLYYVSELYRLAGVEFAAGVALPLLEQAPGKLDGRLLASALCDAQPQAAARVLRIEQSKMAKQLAALIGAGTGFVRHQLMSKDFIGGVITDFSDLTDDGTRSLAQLGFIAYQAKQQIRAMGAILGLPEETVRDAIDAFRVELADCLRRVFDYAGGGDPSFSICRDQARAWAQQLTEKRKTGRASETPIVNDSDRVFFANMGPKYEEAAVELLSGSFFDPAREGPHID